jgi:hypothetical protein
MAHFKKHYMRRTLTLLIGLALMTGCKEKIEKFVFDTLKMTDLTKYSYSYESGKLTSSKETAYMLMAGQIVDSTITVTNYEYDNKGLLRKELSKTVLDDNADQKVYNYASNDSLISELTISSEGDTILWSVYDYFPDGRQKVFFRFLTRKIDIERDFTESMMNKQFDTILYRKEYKYDKGLCQSILEFDNESNLTRRVENEYEKGKLKKATHFLKTNSLEVTEKTQYFNYSKSELHPDYFSLDLKNDTIEYCKNEFIDNVISTTTMVFEYGQNISKTFFEKGKEIGNIGIDKNMNFKTVESYSYNENGDLKETKSYSEEIKNAP